MAQVDLVRVRVRIRVRVRVMCSAFDTCAPRRLAPSSTCSRLAACST